MINKVDLLIVVNKEDNNTNFLGINEYPGVGYIKSYLQSKGYTVNIRIVCSDQINLLESLFEYIPDFIGFNMYSDNVCQVLRAVQKVRESYPHCHITIGGPQVNQFESQILVDNPGIDTVISYEGEETICQLLECLNGNGDINECTGITYREKNGAIIKNPSRYPIQKLDNLPFPSRDIYEKERQQYLYITGSRGCLGGCSFCGETSSKIELRNSYVRLRSIENIISEIEYLVKKYRVYSFRFTDATFEDPFDVGQDRAIKLFNMIIERNLKISLHLFTRAEIVNKLPIEYYILAKKAGVECFYIGIESGNEFDLKIYNKRTSIEKNNAAMEKIRQAGIHVGIGFINFNPYSSFESILSNATFLHKSGLGHVFYLYQTRLELLPQAVIKKKLLKDGYISKDFNYKSHYYDYRFSDKRIECLYNFLKGVYTDIPIYYMDTILRMNQVWVKRKLSGEKLNQIMKDYSILDSLCEEYNYKNYELVCKAISLIRDNAKDEALQSLSRQYNLSDVYEPYVNIYNRLNVRITKERIKDMSKD